MICKRIGGFNPEECNVAGMGPNSGKLPPVPACSFPRISGPGGMLTRITRKSWQERSCRRKLPPGGLVHLEYWGVGGKGVTDQQDLLHPKGNYLPSFFLTLYLFSALLGGLKVTWQTETQFVLSVLWGKSRVALNEWAGSA